MNIPLLTWSAVVALISIVLIVRVVYLSRHHHWRHHCRRIIELGSESEEFFAPGDPLKSDNHYYDDYE